MHDIKNIYNQELECLESAVKNGKNPYHTFTLATKSSNFPEARTVVLRDVDREPLKIYFNADFRRPKVEELKNNQLCSALFYDMSRRIQLRFKCKGKLHYQNEASIRVWENTPLQSRKCYMGPYSPSTPLDKWHPNIPMEYLKTDPEREHSKQGYINFTHIELEVLESDILQLHHDGHIRFGLRNGKELIYLSP